VGGQGQLHAHSGTRTPLALPHPRVPRVSNASLLWPAALPWRSFGCCRCSKCWALPLPSLPPHPPALYQAAVPRVSTLMRWLTRAASTSACPSSCSRWKEPMRSGLPLLRMWVWDCRWQCVVDERRTRTLPAHQAAGGQGAEGPCAAARRRRAGGVEAGDCRRRGASHRQTSS